MSLIVNQIGQDSDLAEGRLPNGEIIRPQMIDLFGCYWGIGLFRLQTEKKCVFLGSSKIPRLSRNLGLFVLTPFVRVSCFLVECMASTPENGHILRSMFLGSVQYDTQGA
jgi:hypothetical protein